jgi:hypothetical protein
MEDEGGKMEGKGKGDGGGDVKLESAKIGALK